MTGGYVSIITLQVDWQESSDQVLLIHIESIYAYAYVYMQNIFWIGLEFVYVTL